MISDIAHSISIVPDHGSAIRQIAFLGPLELTLSGARGGPDHPQCNRGRLITHQPRVLGSARTIFT